MKRGELWTAAGGGNYSGKPRPILIVQDDRFDSTDSITICPLTSDPTEIPLLRIPIKAELSTGLTKHSSIMVEKVTTIPRANLGERIGVLSDTTMLAFSRTLIVFLGIA